MAGTIKGITIEFRGETTKLDKALKDIDKDTRSIDKELKQVNNDLKFNPSNVELWKQKQQLLSDKVKETSQRLDILKDAQKQLDASGVEKNSEEYRQLQREIIETESKLKTFKGQLKQVGDVKLTALSKQLDTISQKTHGLSMAGGAIAGGLLANTVNTARQVDDIATLAQQYGVTTDEIQKFNYAQELVDVDTQTMLGSMQKMTKQMGANNSAFSTLGVSITDANGEMRDSTAVWYDVLSALGNVENETQRDILAQELFGRSAAELAGIIDDGGASLKAYGQEAEDAGLIMSSDDVDAANKFNDALDKLKGTISGNLLKAGAQLAESLLPVFEKISSAVGTVLTWFGNLDGKTQMIILSIAGAIAAISPVAGVLGKITKAISIAKTAMTAIMPFIAGISLPVLGIVAAIAAVIAILVVLWKKSETFRNIVTAIWEGIKTVIMAVVDNIRTKWEAFKTFLAVTIEVIKAIIESLKQKWESFKEKVAMVVDAVKQRLEDIKQKWEDFKQKISDGIQTIKDKFEEWREKVQSVVDSIKDKFEWLKKKVQPIIDFFSGIGNTISGIFSGGGKISAPNISAASVGVSWHASGGIFTRPTIAGIGEAGDEAVIPLDKFWKKLEQLNTGGDNIVINVYGTEGQSPQAIAAEVKRMLIQETKRGTMAWA